jgi:sec-independent protein translocase protein TatA
MQIGIPEIILIIIIIALIFGPKKLSKYTSDLGKVFGSLRKELKEVEDNILQGVIETEKPLTVFVSSVINELQDERNNIVDAIKSIPITRPWLFEYSPPSSDEVEEVYIDQVKKCDIFVLIVGHSVSDAVIKEYEIAKELKKPILVVIKKCTKEAATMSFIKSIEFKWNEYSDISQFISLIKCALADELIRGYRRYRLSAEQVSALFIMIETLDVKLSFSPAVDEDSVDGKWKLKAMWRKDSFFIVEILLLKKNGDVVLPHAARIEKPKLWSRHEEKTKLSGTVITIGHDHKKNKKIVSEGKWSLRNNRVYITSNDGLVNYYGIKTGRSMSGYITIKGWRRKEDWFASKM